MTFQINAIFKDGPNSFEATLRQALIHGNLDGAERTISTLERDRSSAARALALGLRYALFSAGKAGPPNLAEIEAIPRNDEPTSALLALICAAVQRVSFLTFDLQSLEGWLQFQVGLSGLKNEGRLRLSLGKAWVQVMEGHYAEATESLQEVRREAKAQKIASCLVDAEATLAFVLLSEGQIDQSVQIARRASRMAAAEELPYQELFAHLVLARVRRMAGAPFLASKILAALASIAPPPWHPWLSWESLLSGVTDPQRSVVPCPAQEASWALTQLLIHARNGNRGGFDKAFANTLTMLSGFAAMASDVTMLAACLDGSLTMDDAFPQVAEWSRGNSSEVPCGFHGIVRAGQETEATPTVGFVWANPGRRARRILSAGIPLARSDGSVLIDREKRPRDRTHAALAALALLDEQKTDERQFFGELYGFEYDHAYHKHVLDMLVGRMRTMLGDSGKINRAKGELRLELDGPFLLWDPRCERPLGDWILSALAEGGPQTAKATAALLGVSLRAVQNVLKDLTSTGACVQTREGRSLLYKVEDTTFSEPTQSRFRCAFRPT